MNAHDLRQRHQLLIAFGLLLLLGGVAYFRPIPVPGAPPRIPLSLATTWMADCLPGVGAKNRQRVAEMLRSGDCDALPKRAQAMARDVFIEFKP